MRVFIWSPYSTWKVHAAHEFTVARALQLRGAEVEVWLCDGLFPECDIYKQPGLGLKSTRPTDLCQFCQYRSMEMAYKTVAPVRWLGRHVPHALFEEAKLWVNSLTSQELLTAHWDGQPLADWTASSALSQFRLSTVLIENQEVQALFRRNLQGAVIAYEGLRRAMDIQNPDAMLVFNGRFYPHRIAIELARQRGIRFLTHERGTRKEQIMLRENSTIHELKAYQTMWERAKLRPLQPQELRSVGTWLEDRRHARNLNWRPFSPMPTEQESLRQALNLDERPIVAMFTSSDDEVLAYPEWRIGAFPNSMDWIPASVELARRMPETQWVIRMHPNLVGLGNNIQAIQQAQTLAQNLPENCRIVMPADDVSSYTLADMAECGVVYCTTMGLEMAARGQAVVAVAQGWYGPTDLVSSFVQDPKDYEAAVRHALQKGFSYNAARAAYRHYHRVLEENSLPFPWVTEPQLHLGVPTWKYAEELEVGRCKTLDRICDFLMKGDPVFPAPSTATQQQNSSHEYRFLLNIYPWLMEASDLPDPSEADQCLQQGEEAFAAGDIEGALASFQKAIRLEPEHIDAHNNLGATYHALGNHEAAVESLKTAVRIDHGHGVSWVNLIEVLIAIKHFDEAGRVLAEARHYAPNDPNIMAFSQEQA